MQKPLRRKIGPRKMRLVRTCKIAIFFQVIFFEKNEYNSDVGLPELQKHTHISMFISERYSSPVS